MSNSSLAAQAVAQGPMTAAPPSFDGHGWLVVINLAGMTTCTLIAVMVLLMLATDSWRYRRKERATGMTAARVWRRIGLLYAMGVAIRSGAAAWVLWRWDPLDPGGTATALLLQRILDPLALACAVLGLGLFVVSLPGMLEKLRREPPPLKMWQENRVLWRIAGCATLSFIAAIGVVSTR
jgi:hypothetical protein